MAKEEHLGREQRQYLRLDTVFPVQFRLVGIDAQGFLSDWLQGFTNNLSRGGICLVVNNLPPELARLLKERKAKVSLEIDLPIAKKPIVALANPTWVKDEGSSPRKYYIGLCYETINPIQNDKLMHYARGKKIFIPLALVIIFLLGMGLVLNSFVNMKLKQSNRLLVRKLVNVIQEARNVKKEIKGVSVERDSLEGKIKGLEFRLKTIEEEKNKLGSEPNIELIVQSRKIRELSSLTSQLTQEKEDLNKQLSVVRLKEEVASKELEQIDKKKAILEKANFENMYKWLQVHQSPRTGLVISFEGDNDIKGWALIYDQALAAQAYTYFNDFERAKKTLDFFCYKAERKEGFFLNAYYARDGSPAEYILHSGPNIWLGIAILQYTHKSGDKSYINVAEDIAKVIINLQEQDSDGGICGGPGLEWYSTEHNLDAYAFFNMLYKLTGKQKYVDVANNVLNWIVKNAYDKADIPIKRGKGDSTIATDTYAWSVAAIGPEKLENLGMSPDRIMEFAETNCLVDVSYTPPEGGQTIRIKGFDFTPQKHVARGGMVSSEWTAQMVISFKIMADYYLKKGINSKGQSYKLKADEYLASLINMIISSPSPSGQGESCLPYATQDFADTGHGWFTPKGKSTGSVSGTAYTVFAYYNYNPLEIKD